MLSHINLLFYFGKLVETGSYTLIAAYFEITQPTITVAIKRLTKNFNDPLIIKKIARAS
ncbi:LysR family transcriptional regulator [Lactobacillus sp. ESL0791]|uniref:helix-turn-helix domain-containing protein n=1 Tax=Lactobacillus sp. ESL0791 TaxID=2983234 RepID=UPI0023F84520|nr:LysR family transcriptional regulator [Lactobacillus sp. ESL0791]MDF7639021.1 LysR family transcriptional regulator [Lactobacillus sp. ESL0791]